MSRSTCPAKVGNADVVCYYSFLPHGTALELEHVTLFVDTVGDVDLLPYLGQEEIERLTEEVKRKDFGC